jgi:phosphopantetheinyl transferase
MYRIVLGKVSTLSAAPLPPGLREQAPQGPRRERWLAGRALLSHTLSPLPEIIYGEQGKPAFAPEMPLWFNLSHSGDDIALLLSDEGEVGCDIEVIRPRANWRWLANAVFMDLSLGVTGPLAGLVMSWAGVPVIYLAAAGLVAIALLLTWRWKPLMQH